ncbi:MAG: S41 family peptidase [Candidatus Azobacteroides sp.]|nr:S41 family peptidase [Candidatus Azobacteroides sp.]
MKIIRSAVFLLFFCGLTACLPEDDFNPSPQANFDALWKIMDEHYCFFEYKKIDWNDVYAKYQPRITSQMSDEALFKELGDMLAELKDGHVNLVSNFSMSRYWDWYLDYPDNFDSKIQRNYLERDYYITSGIDYKILDDNIGYMYYGNFSNGIGDSNLDQIIKKFYGCPGIIIDIRNNSGGLLTNVDVLASRFTGEKILTGYSKYKTGKGHRDFSKPEAKYLNPSDRLRYQKTVVVLTNRQCFSAANEFVNVMRLLPTVTVMGDRTGGGSGFPMSSELPNGWSVRYSACPGYTPDMKDIEFGIDPDIKVDMTESDMRKGIDTMIETARQYITAQKNNSKN